MIRRVVSIALFGLALPLWVVAAPIWIPLALAADAIGRLGRLPTLRLGAFAGVYLAHDLAGVAVAGWLWLTAPLGRQVDLDAHRALQGWWANSLLTWAGRLLGVRIEPIDPSNLPSATFVLLSRHASMADAVLPAALVAGPMGRCIHYVLKRELRWDPAIDIVGGRLGNHFVDRGGDTASESTAIEELAARAADDAVLVIFPEGTYATSRTRRRVLRSLRRRGEEEAAVLAERLQHLLPPRPAGTLAMLRGRPEADVVVLGHIGLEGVASLRGLRRRLPLTEPVRTRTWLHPRAELPSDDDGLMIWLQGRWEELDDWIEANRAPAGR